MLNKMKQTIEKKGYTSTIIDSNLIEIKFEKMIVRIRVENNKYNVYIINPKTQEIENSKNYKYPKCVMNFILDNWLEYNSY
jgi:hypothetical protein